MKKTILFVMLICLSTLAKAQFIQQSYGPEIHNASEFLEKTVTITTPENSKIYVHFYNNASTSFGIYIDGDDCNNGGSYEISYKLYSDEYPTGIFPTMYHSSSYGTLLETLENGVPSDFIPSDFIETDDVTLNYNSDRTAKIDIYDMNTHKHLCTVDMDIVNFGNGKISVAWGAY